VVAHACHATVLEHDNLLYSADFPGAAVRFVERNLGGTAIYVQGACADVNPVWMRHDFDEVERVGGIVGAAATRTVHELRPQGAGQWVVNLSWSEEIPVDTGTGAVLEGVSLAAASRRIDLPLKAPDALAAIEAELAEVAARLAEGRRDRRLLERRAELQMARVRAARPPSGDTQEIEIQALRLSPGCAVVALPGEFFVETGRAIAAAAGVDHLIVACYANGYVSYVAPAAAFRHGGYEVGISRFAPGAEAIVVREAAALVRELVGSVGATDAEMGSRAPTRE